MKWMCIAMFSKVRNWRDADIFFFSLCVQERRKAEVRTKEIQLPGTMFFFSVYLGFDRENIINTFLIVRCQPSMEFSMRCTAIFVFSSFRFLKRSNWRTVIIRPLTIQSGGWTLRVSVCPTRREFPFVQSMMSSVTFLTSDRVSHETLKRRTIRIHEMLTRQ